LDGYAATPLVSLPELAAELGIGFVLAKDESSRLGLPAFKALGASWAIHRVLSGTPGDGPFTLVTATDGNHGRAVARFARLMGHRASIVIPSVVHASAVQAIRDEGAEVLVLDASYDEAVEAAVAENEITSASENLDAQSLAFRFGHGGSYVIGCRTGGEIFRLSPKRDRRQRGEHNVFLKACRCF
jgi:threonine dehydratase